MRICLFDFEKAQTIFEGWLTYSYKRGYFIRRAICTPVNNRDRIKLNLRSVALFERRVKGGTPLRLNFACKVLGAILYKVHK